MDYKKLNKSVLMAQDGDVASLWKVKAMFQPIIHHLSDKNRNLIDSQESFEEECFRAIEQAVTSYRENKGEAYPLIFNNIVRRLNQRRRRFRKKVGEVLFSGLPVLADEDGGEGSEVPVIDNLAVIDENLLLKERIAGLASDDPRREFVLKSWIDPHYNDSQTAEMLAQIDGKKTETHRKFIHRFRTECQKALADAV